MKNALCLGTFDGVHIGHRTVIALADGYNRIAVTFKKPPRAVISGKEELICTFENKCAILKRNGINEIAALDFEEVKNISARDFFNFLLDTYNPAVIVCGFNYRFGKNGEGDTELLSELCQKNGINFRYSEPVEYSGEPVSSTAIRGYIKNGEIEKANSLLSEPFSFTAAVKHGEKRGRTIGFPTINQEYPKELVRLKKGVYKVKIDIEGKEYLGISDIGQRPTYPIDYIISETFISDFSGDLYGKEIKITPTLFLREEKKFCSLEELKKQLEEDLNKI